MRILVTGGAGYIGSVVVRELMAAHHDVVVLDNLVTGHRAAVPSDVPFHGVDTRDTGAVEAVLREHRTDAVVHMAALSQVGTSVQQPREYFDNNVRGGLSLLDAMLRADVGRIVFSSTAAVYGEPDRVPIDESAPTRPTSPYGESKLFLEQAMARYHAAYGLRFVALRYFNAAGAHAQAGEDHRPETHLVPRVLMAALGSGPPVGIWGNDYPTRDGTCVRDYVHVVDLAAAHRLALEATASRSATYNLGSGDGHTVREVLDCATRVVGRPIPSEQAPRRAGDPATLIASSEAIRRELGWAPQREALSEIIGSAWEWLRTHPAGYAG